MLRDHSAKVQNVGMFDWNDLRAFLAVAETGSTLAAGRKLRVSQTTAARRVSALEQALGVILFERRQAGYVLTPTGEELVEKARAVEAAADSLADAAAAKARDVGGIVRLTTEEIFAVTVLAPILRELHQAYPAIRIELDTTEELRDLAAGEAEVALRACRTPEGSGLVGRRIIDDQWTFYCSRGYAAANGKPRNVRELREHPLIAGGGKQLWRSYGAWLRDHDLEGAVAMHHGSAMGLLAAARSGIGLAVLPCFIAEFEPDLVRCLPPTADDRALWLPTHERLRHTPRVRAVIDFLAERLMRIARELRDRNEAELSLT